MEEDITQWVQETRQAVGEKVVEAGEKIKPQEPTLAEKAEELATTAENKTKELVDKAIVALGLEQKTIKEKLQEKG